ncbi:hypothetical protein B0H67DRAFT_267481 [Lasiosphaeris hirsuta]|uniref:Nuclear cap-binding protein subunit 2 n=1 Tax=Lasiosphaeris hirsuta TaxID=260670 RepID=A0AA40A806_9PEZI|nr:hypothetical protein B0H67DRAFT_267481 [Lasiosphaeris hirsuta]
MRGQRPTVDRLDRPSAYFNNRVSTRNEGHSTPGSRTDDGSRYPQNKRRRPGQDRRDDDDTKMQHDEPEDDPLRDATTLYVGNLSFYTTEEQVYELFSKCGEIKRLIMGLDRFNKTPCGFCFVEYYTHQDALDCMKYIGGTKLDERIIRTDLDPGFEEGRQYGRGKSGGQVRDEYREDYDEGRGGLGRAIQQAERLRDAERRDKENDHGSDHGRLR